MPKDLIRYDLLVQDALKGVVRKVLSDAVRDGLPGDHHFYVSFRTDMPGVRVSNRLREKYPEEMTIVLQHQFWGLGVTDNGFEVGLSFSGEPERLQVPYEAVTGFFDPSVQFGLKFEVKDEVPKAEADQDTGETVNDDTPGEMAPIPLMPAKDSARAEKPQPAVKAAKGAENKDASPEKKTRPAKADPDSEAKAAADKSGADVVNLDAFRKKH